MDLDIPDTQIWIFAANQSEQWAVDIYEEVLNGNRVVYVPRYIAAEFYDVMERVQGATGRNKAFEHLLNLWKAPAAFSPHPFLLSGYRLQDIWHNARTSLLSAITDASRSDAPIIADAYRMAELVDSYNPPNSWPHAVPRYSEQARLLRHLHTNNINQIVSKVLTNDKPLSQINLSKLGINSVEIEKYP